MNLVSWPEAATSKLKIENNIEIENKELPTHRLLYINITINVITHNQSPSKSKHIFN